MTARPLFWLFLSLSLTSCTSVLGQEMTPSLGSCDDCSPEAADQPISEVPQGVINGRNTSFTISKVPTLDRPLQLFRNGVPLANGIDFRATGQIINTSTAQTPMPGDMIQVRYIPSSLSQSKSRGSQLFNPPASVQPNGAAAANELTTAAARLALGSEIANAKSSHGILGRRSRGSAPPSVAEAPMPDSIRMLYETAQTPPSYQGKHPGKPRRSVSVQGVEGLGDGLPNSYASASDLGESHEEVLQERRLSEPSGLDGSLASPGAHSEVRSGQAIDMLRQRLRGRDAQDANASPSRNPYSEHSPMSPTAHSEIRSSQAIDMLQRRLRDQDEDPSPGRDSYLDNPPKRPRLRLPWPF